MRQKRRPDFEATEHATRTRLGAHPIHFIPAPTTVAPHTHHAREIVSDPFDLTAADDVQEAIEELTTEKLARSGVQPMLGNLNLNQFYIYDLGALRFDTDTVVAAVDGGLQWADDAGIERLVMRADGVDMPVGGVYIKVKNTFGSTIAAGRAVVLSGSDGAGNVLTVAPADIAMALNDTMALGVTMQSIANGAKGWVCRLGYVGSLDLSAYTDGLQLYVTDDVGTLGGTIPAKGCAARIRMAMVIDSSNPGSMWVDPDWRPDLDELANVSIGDYGAKQFFDVPMWLPQQDGEPCFAWRDVPASRWPVVESTADYEIVTKDVVLLASANGADLIVTLPDLAADPFNLNRWVRIKKVGGAFAVDVQTSGGDLIDSTYTSVKLKKVGEVLDIQSAQFGGDPFWEIQ